MRVLFEHQFTMDGNRIDNAFSEPNDIEGRQRNTVNLERAWIEYEFPHTGLALQVGARLWTLDQAAVIGDDDPRIALTYKVGDLEFQAAAVIQTESLRVGLENDNDDVYYTFGVDYKAKPWQFGVHGAYFRWRNAGATLPGATQRSTLGQKQDSVIIMPSVRGQFSIVKFLVQPMVVFGSADRSDAGIAGGASRSMDIFAWGVIGEVEANLGKIRPFFAFAIGSGDDDPNDNDLNGFAPLPQREITLTSGQPEFAVLTQSPSWGSRDVGPPARSGPLGVGNEFLHSNSNPFNDRIGNGLHGLNTTYSNPGTFTLVPGVKIFPVKGHEVDLWYAYRAIMESALVEAQIGAANVDESMVHEFSVMYTWSINKHFDIRAVGNLSLLASGGQDIAETVICNTATGATCKGEDVALRGQVRFRARF
jgi:hypothetical protein